MKKLFTITVLTAFACLLVLAQDPCLPDGISFSTQEQIDNFQTDYPGCTEIEGDVDIYGPDIINFSGLNAITSIGGKLMFFSNSSLTSMSGLENLSYIGGSLEIDDNNAITSLSGLEGLTTVSGTLQIRYNDVLSSLSGLVNLTTVGQHFWIVKNAMTDLTGLENLVSIGGALGVEQNSVLTSLAGIENINPGSISSLRIYHNPLLSTCHVKSVCDYLAEPNAEFQIYGNTYPCHNHLEIVESCVFGIIDNSAELSRLSIYPNPSDDDYITITLENKYNNLRLACFNIFGQEVHQQEVTSTETLISIGAWQPGIYLAVIYEDGKPISRAKFVVR